jgi:hypothetical protein
MMKAAPLQTILKDGESPDPLSDLKLNNQVMA